MSTTDWTAAEKLHTRLDALKSEDDFAHGLDGLWKYPEFETRELTETERDLRDWGYIYGLAFGLAIAANPKMSFEVAAELAYTPARRVFAAWSGEIEDPGVKREQAIRRVVEQFAKASDARDARIFSGGPYGPLEMTDDLRDAVCDLAMWARG